MTNPPSQWPQTIESEEFYYGQPYDWGPVSEAWREAAKPVLERIAMTNRSLEPWRVEHRPKFDEWGEYVVLGKCGTPGCDRGLTTKCCDGALAALCLDKADANRILACVNALAGVPTEDVSPTLDALRKIASNHGITVRLAAEQAAE